MVSETVKEICSVLGVSLSLKKVIGPKIKVPPGGGGGVWYAFSKGLTSSFVRAGILPLVGEVFQDSLDNKCEASDDRPQQV